MRSQKIWEHVRSRSLKKRLRQPLVCSVHQVIHQTKFEKQDWIWAQKIWLSTPLLQRGPVSSENSDLSVSCNCDSVARVNDSTRVTNFSNRTRASNVEKRWWFDSSYVFCRVARLESQIMTRVRVIFYKISKQLVDKLSSFAHKEMLLLLPLCLILALLFPFWLCLLVVLCSLVGLKHFTNRFSHSRTHWEQLLSLSQSPETNHVG